MYSKIIDFISLTLHLLFDKFNSTFNVLKKLLVQALSQQFPLRLMLWREDGQRRLRVDVNSALQYCIPRSECIHHLKKNHLLVVIAIYVIKYYILIVWKYSVIYLMEYFHTIKDGIRPYCT